METKKILSDILGVSETATERALKRAHAHQQNTALNNLISSAADLFSSDGLATIRGEAFLLDDGSLSEIIGEALSRWLRSRVPAGTPNHAIDAHAGRIGLEILGVSDARHLSDVVALSAFTWMTTSIQPELCEAIDAIILKSEASLQAAPEGQL